MIPNFVYAEGDIYFCEFSSTKHIIKERLLFDFAKNEFKLYELESGYAIYELDMNQELMMMMGIFGKQLERV